MNMLPRNLDSSIRLGVTGPPGAGKSSLIESFGKFLLETRKISKFAVLPIDPSSDISGGSLLGDKTRMPTLSSHPDAYIRPSPAQGSLGGITQTTSQVADLCAAAGFDLITIESVGVGQSEKDISSIVDVTVLVVAPGGGDELQTMKKGVLECADVVAVNKCDLEGAEETVSFYKNGFMHNSKDRRVVSVSAKTGAGLAELWAAIKETAEAYTNKEENKFKSKHFQRQRLQMHLQTLYLQWFLLYY
jgi:LAO/AO transport system kinase